MARNLIVVALVLLAGWIALDWANDDARRIERRWTKLQKLAAKSPVETQFQGAGKAKSIADLFASSFELRAEPENYATSNRQDLVRGILSYRARTTTLSLAVGREDLFVDPGGTTAIHYAHVEFISDVRDLMGTESYPVRIEWVEEGGEWVIAKLEVLREER